MSGGPCIEMDGRLLPFEEGETLLEIARRVGVEIPTLCYDPRLEAFGGCRLCIVSVKGFRNPVASCTTRAEDGMVVETRTEEILSVRRTLLEMVASEIRTPEAPELAGMAAREFQHTIAAHGARTDRFRGALSGRRREDDDNPFILRDYEQCIACYRCVRVCAEQEGDHAISVAGRGFQARIATEGDGLLEGSACTFCGQCVQTCPTGALADRKALRFEDLPGAVRKTRTICNYCGVGCSVDLLSKGDRLVGIHPAMDGRANQGALCVKGQFAFDFVQHEERLTTPLVRGDDGRLHPASWDEALDRAAEGLRRAADAHGPASLYAIASGRAPNEAAYVLQKLMRAGWGINHVDNCSRA